MAKQSGSNEKKLLILGTGGSPGNGVVRSLKAAPEPLTVIGTEIDQYTYFRSQADRTYLTPKTSSPDSLKALQEIIEKEKITFIHAQPEREVLHLSKHRAFLDQMGVKYFLPSHETIINCQDKFRSYRIWQEKGLRVPKTMMIENENDLRTAFQELGPKIWLRIIIGGGGEGAVPTDDFEFARIWIDRRNGWGKFTAAELLSSQSVTWSSVWNQGRLVVAQSRRRLYWEYASKFLSGVSGITGTGVTMDDPVLNEVALKAILAIDPKPHGIFSVDLTEGLDRNLNLTEINIGRFFTTIEFFTRAGLNMPYILYKEAMNEPVAVPKTINPLPNGLYWVRGVDFEPRLVSSEDMGRAEEALKRWKA